MASGPMSKWVGRSQLGANGISPGKFRIFVFLYDPNRLEALETHRKFNIAQKFMKPIFIGLLFLDLSRKNTKSRKRTILPLGEMK